MADAAIVDPPARTDPPPRGRCRCGYDLRGIDSYVCPECGRAIERPPILPQAYIDRLLSPVDWPAKYAFRTMIVLTVIEAVALPPRFLALMLWLIAYSIIMYRYWRRAHYLRAMSRYYNVVLTPKLLEQQAVWRARRWFALGLILTMLHLPQIVSFVIELPLLNHEIHRVYELEPLNGPHHWYWCGFQPVTNLDVRPSGVSFCLGMRPIGYCRDNLEQSYGPWQWQHIYGPWWLFDFREIRL